MWIYNGKEFVDDDIGDYVGFVYIITNLISGKQYVGKKLFTKAKINRTVKDGVVIKKRSSRVCSDWKSYYGSNEELKNEVKSLGSSNFKREILFLCKSKSELSYRETYEIFSRHTLLGDGFYNSWVSCKINKKNLKNMLTYS